MKPKIIITNVDHTQFAMFRFFDYSGILQALQLYKKVKDGKHTRNKQRAKKPLSPHVCVCELMLPFISFHLIRFSNPTAAFLRIESVYLETVTNERMRIRSSIKKKYNLNPYGMISIRKSNVWNFS